MRYIPISILVCVASLIGCSSNSSTPSLPEAPTPSTPSDTSASTPSPRVESKVVSSPQHDAVLVVNAATKGVNGPSLRSDMARSGESSCGPDASQSKLSWKFTEHRDGNDYYQFDWTLTNNGKMVNFKGLSVGFDGSSEATVIDAEHHIVIQKRLVNRDAETAK